MVGTNRKRRGRLSDWQWIETVKFHRLPVKWADAAVIGQDSWYVLVAPGLACYFDVRLTVGGIAWVTGLTSPA